MNKDKLREIYNDFEQFISNVQNTFQMLSIQELIKGMNNPNDWSNNQYSNVNYFQKKLELVGAKALKQINSKIEDSLIKTYQVSSLDGNYKQEEVSKKMETIKMISALAIASLIKDTSRIHFKNVDEINQKYLFDKGTYVTKETQSLYDVICDKVAQYGSPENVPKVIYTDGKKFEWRAYMNMNVRTTLNQEATSKELESGKENSIVFYICSQHSDCAEDHIDYQGKIYYDNAYKSFNLDKETLDMIDTYISSNKLMSIQEVMEGPVYLTTRPNCRHYFAPIPLDEINKSKTTILNELSMNKGKGDEELYRNTQIQRYNERQIRKWKSERDNALITLNNHPNGVDLSSIKNRIDTCNLKINEWQERQRDLVNKHNLERDREREKVNYLVNDLGARTNKYLKR